MESPIVSAFGDETHASPVVTGSRKFGRVGSRTRFAGSPPILLCLAPGRGPPRAPVADHR